MIGHITRIKSIIIIKTKEDSEVAIRALGWALEAVGKELYEADPNDTATVEKLYCIQATLQEMYNAAE